MIKKITLSLFILTIILFRWIHFSDESLPTVRELFMAFTGYKISFDLFLIIICFIFGSFPFILITYMFLYTGKYLYMNKDELWKRHLIFIEAFLFHMSLMALLQTILCIVNVYENELYNVVKPPIQKQIEYSINIYVLFVTTISTALKIPFLSILIEFLILNDLSISIKPIIRHSIIPLGISMISFVLSFLFEFIMDENFIKYLELTYIEFIPKLDTLTDTIYSISMYGCIYSAILNYYRVW